MSSNQKIICIEEVWDYKVCQLDSQDWPQDN